MRAFIIRPFGKKKDGGQNEIDFDEVERTLFDPALLALGVEGRTTLDIVRAGNIRVDMFSRLLTADLVVADLSIHNANVFYELGIRHALRDKRTFVARCESDSYPFDLQTDRYFTYDRERPAASLDALVAALRQTIRSEDADSPVFRLLPELKVQERSRFLPVPLDFREAIEQAAADGQVGDLELLGAEAAGFEWESEGLRMVGRALFKLKAYESATTAWEKIRVLDARDLEANTTLGTIYERAGDWTRSDQALQRALDLKGLDRHDRAEVQALIGRNAKTRWRAEWERSPPERQRPQALRSGYLIDSYMSYARAFNEDLNHYYSGLNALALLTIQIELATALPEIWEARFDKAPDAQRELETYREQSRRLAAAVELSLLSTLNRLEREGRTDPWAEISQADLRLLTLERPARVATAYQQALSGADAFTLDCVRGQLALYRKLGVREANVQASLAVLEPTPSADVSVPGVEKKSSRVLLFTGHMLDAPDRKEPRFPPDKEGAARQAIRDAVSAEAQLAGGVAYGTAGGACGGDILFHEVAAELGIPTKLFLALPREQYIRASVQHGGPQWVERFRQLRDRLPTRRLGESEELPRWLQENTDYDIWQRNNLWLLYNALAGGGENVTLIALWNGERGDGPGGTEDLVRKAKERGAKIIILDTKKLFGV